MITQFALPILFPLSQMTLAHIGHGNFLTQNLAQLNLSPILMLSGIGLALMAGAGHALSPGHGKTMAAAYLVGSQGTPKHAVLLGIVTTLTHTISVFALGILAFVLSRYILPEQWYPLLSLISGLMVCGVGFWLLDRFLYPTHRHRHTHSPAANHQHPVPKITLRSLVSLGIAAGLVPCPSALVLLLSAIALHQTVYGLFLVCAFSCGLASVLISIGFIVIYAHRWLMQVSWIQLLQPYISVISAIGVIAVGMTLTVCSVI